MAFLDPYAVDGATITASQLRREVFAYTKGATGIDGPEDLKVVAVAGSPGVAGILPGGGSVAVESRRESYSVTNTAMDGDALVDVPPAGSGGATHYVIIEVTDPEFHGQEAVATPRLVSSLSGRTSPFLPLARIDLEPGESFDATSEVTDLRVVAVPRKERHLFAWNVPSGTVHTLTNESQPEGQAFPNFWTAPGYYPWWVDVPEWGTHVTMIGQWHGVRVFPVQGRWGRIWARLGHHSGDSEYIGEVDTRTVDWNLSDVGGSYVQREFWAVGDARPVPENMRGTRQPLMLRGLRMSAGSGSQSGPELNNWSSVTLDVEFVERPV